MLLGKAEGRDAATRCRGMKKFALVSHRLVLSAFLMGAKEMKIVVGWKNCSESKSVAQTLKGLSVELVFPKT